MASGAIWSPDELRACVHEYAILWRDQKVGLETPKKAMIDRLLAGPLKARTKGSIEYRMANISAIMEAADKPFLNGYVPARNVGPTNTPLIEKMLLEEGLI